MQSMNSKLIRKSFIEHYTVVVPGVRDGIIRMVSRVNPAVRAYGAWVEKTEVPLSIHSEWLDLFRAYLARGGKFLRSYLSYLCLETCDLQPCEFMEIMAVVEFVQSASLMLDDIVDDSKLRRGGKASHSEVDVGVAGGSASGWLNMASVIIEESQSSRIQEVKSDLLSIVAEEHFLTGVGTAIDLVWSLDNLREYQAEWYLQSILHRTGAYSYRLPIRMALSAGGISDTIGHPLTKYSECLGLILQIVDDILNIQAEGRCWGKAFAEDITTNKKNLIQIFSTSSPLLSTADKEQLRKIYSSRVTEESTLKEAVEIICRSGAIDQARALASSIFQEALDHLEKWKECSDSHRNIFRDVAYYSLHRK
jgi:geranylgeranyl pyrophosphate synthase